MDTGILQMMMQMMQAQNQMMTMLLSQVSQTNSLTPPQPQSMAEAKPVETKIDLITNGEIENLKAQVAQLQQQLKSTQTELAGTKQTLEAYKQSYQNATQASSSSGAELSALKKTVGKAEQVLGRSIDDIAKELTELSGDDYYEEQKKEWQEEGLSGKEMHDKVTAYRDLFKDEDDMINFD